MDKSTSPESRRNLSVTWARFKDDQQALAAAINDALAEERFCEEERTVIVRIVCEALWERPTSDAKKETAP